MANRLRDLVGQRFGRLTGVERVGSDNHGTATWTFDCECGKRVVRTGSEVTRGKTSSCGCLRAELPPPSLTHGGWGRPEWHAWSSMRGRCTRTTHKAYSRYGGRGITVCARWDVYEAFLADMGRRPSDGHSLDRIDNSKGYSPENCRWATRTVQTRNMRSNVVLALGERSMCLVDWAHELGITPQAIRNRMRNGWPLERALTERGRVNGCPRSTPRALPWWCSPRSTASRRTASGACVRGARGSTLLSPSCSRTTSVMCYSLGRLGAAAG